MDISEKYFISQLEYVVFINVYENGKKTEVAKDDSRFDVIIDNFATMLEGYREMPAFGVSLHDDTCKAIESGIWFEFVFDDIYTHNGMPYNKWLVEIQEGANGFNIIRYYNGKYDGRCFYIDLNEKNMHNPMSDCT